MIKRWLSVTSSAALLAGLLVVGGAGSAFADIGSGCNQGQLPNFGDDANLTATASDDGSGTVTYGLETVNEDPSGGVPGLIEYCVFGTPVPDSSTTDASIAAFGWSDPAQLNVFSWQRPNGDPTNLPFDGSTYTMGTATWNSGTVPAQTILLHINDPVVCGESLTCYVHPAGGPCDVGCGGGAGAPLDISKDATAASTVTYTWDVHKSADKTRVEQIGGTASFTYTVHVTHDAGTEGHYAVTGTITVENTNAFEVAGTTVTDKLDDGTVCSVTGGTNATIPANDTKTFAYSCAPSGNSATKNTAHVDWPDSGPSNELPGGSAFFDKSITWPAATPTDNCTTVSDPLPSGGTSSDNPFPVTICVGDTGDGGAGSGTSAGFTYTYHVSYSVPTHDCVSKTNTATESTDGNTSSVKVTICGPAATGALTMGFWQNKNGQAIITGQAKTGTCGSGTYLRTFAPFQDLTSGSTCAQVATYVTNVIKAATCTSTSKTCNSMLKAQMLATALDVYFSDTALGGNKIGAPGPIGAVKIDLTKICSMIDASGGTATCSGTFRDASGAFGGATALTVSQLLSYAASQSNVGGSTWYAQVKATQVLAKDTFDSINNQVAFSAP
jgi:hypothetical protein